MENLYIVREGCLKRFEDGFRLGFVVKNPDDAVVLLQKAYGYLPAEGIEPLLKSLCKGLKIHVKVNGATEQGWIYVDVEGEDQSIALQLINKGFGLAPNNADNVEKFSVLCGKIIDSKKTVTELNVDIGVFTPKVVYARIPLEALQAQLVDGKKIPIYQLNELFCLLDYMPLHVKIVNTEWDIEGGAFLAELSEHQLVFFTNWLRSMVDRLVITGAKSNDVEHAVEASRHFRDVIKIESLGWLEHAVVCKLGTDAVGLIPAIGRFLRTATLAPFSPRRVKQIVDRPFL
jgi:hypothetical protein